MKLALVVVPLLAFIYGYQNLLVSWLGKENPWTSYLYMYGFGLVFFSSGIILILKSKACVLGRGYDSLWFKVLIGGFVFFASLHAFWIYLATNMPFKGAL